MTLWDIAYLVGAVIVIIILFNKLENKAFMGLILAWLLLSPILGQQEFMLSIHLGNLSLSLQPTRYLLIALIAALVFQIPILYPQYQQASKNNNRFQNWLHIGVVVYCLSVSIITIAYYHQIGGLGRAIAIATNQLAFLLVYFYAMKYVSDKDFDILVKVIWGLALASAVVSTVQFFVNPSFFRLGVAREAFGSYIRPDGLFSAEYYSGFFEIIAIILGLYSARNWLLRIVLLGAGSITVFFTMHRLSWIVLLVVIFIYVIRGGIRFHPGILAVIAFLGAFIVGGAIYFPWDKVENSNVYKNFILERIRSDTLTVRVTYYEFATILMEKYPWGLGAYESSIYQQEAYQAGLIGNTYVGATTEVVPLVIHDGILSAGVKSGIVGMIFFIVFIIGLVIYFGRWVYHGEEVLIIPFLIAIVFFLFNTTNDFSDLSQYVALIFGLLMGYYLSKSRRIIADRTSSEAI